ncbi:hypothetical protein HCEG_06358 [Histoplasma capsulatum var. duboisii H88]|uniref:Uncharacterized protein n=2 Tax=Ajellomyces capsulatus TaxID=5037 RepID=F0ULI9_AJEC8|nr:hypothetical protein HCDG_04905 [Histoplasma capsulatum H143]EGC47143.1 hypothetical protein HCEG_06358 [Histoplasma capsulatum var. duboisii H88]
MASDRLLAQKRPSIYLPECNEAFESRFFGGKLYAYYMGRESNAGPQDLEYFLDYAAVFMDSLGNYRVRRTPKDVTPIASRTRAIQKFPESGAKLPDGRCLAVDVYLGWVLDAGIQGMVLGMVRATVHQPWVGSVGSPKVSAIMRGVGNGRLDIIIFW